MIEIRTVANRHGKPVTAYWYKGQWMTVSQLEKLPEAAVGASAIATRARLHDHYTSMEQVLTTPPKDLGDGAEYFEFLGVMQMMPALGDIRGCYVRAS